MDDRWTSEIFDFYVLLLYKLQSLCDWTFMEPVTSNFACNLPLPILRGYIMNKHKIYCSTGKSVIQLLYLWFYQYNLLNKLQRLCDRPFLRPVASNFGYNLPWPTHRGCRVNEVEILKKKILKPTLLIRPHLFHSAPPCYSLV